MPQAESLSAQSDGVIQPYGDSPLDEEALAETVYLNIINQAQRYVYIYTPYFAVGETMLEASRRRQSGAWTSGWCCRASRTRSSSSG